MTTAIRPNHPAESTLHLLTIDALIEPCRHCAAARQALADLSRALAKQHDLALSAQMYGDEGMPIGSPGPVVPSEINCPVCDDTRFVLTKTGRQLVAIVRLLPFRVEKDELEGLLGDEREISF